VVLSCWIWMYFFYAENLTSLPVLVHLLYFVEDAKRSETKYRK